MKKLLPIAKLGHPLLKVPAKLVTEEDFKDLPTTIENMIFTLNSLGERIGLAAPQVFINKRFFIYRLLKKKHDRYHVQEQEEIPLTVVINPKIRFLTDHKDMGWEACISIPHMMGQVERYRDLEMTFTSLEGKRQTIQAHGFHARVLQHEVDHLEGLTYIDRMKDFSTFGFEDELLKTLTLEA